MRRRKGGWLSVGCHFSGSLLLVFPLSTVILGGWRRSACVGGEQWMVEGGGMERGRWRLYVHYHRLCCSLYTHLHGRTDARTRTRTHTHTHIHTPELWSHIRVSRLVSPLQPVSSSYVAALPTASSSPSSSLLALPRYQSLHLSFHLPLPLPVVVSQEAD